MKPFIMSINCIRALFLILQCCIKWNQLIHDHNKNKTFSYVSNFALRVVSAPTFFWAVGLVVFAPGAFKPTPTCLEATGKLKTNVFSDKYPAFQSISRLLAWTQCEIVQRHQRWLYMNCPIADVNNLNNYTYLRSTLGHCSKKKEDFAKFPSLPLLEYENIPVRTRFLDSVYRLAWQPAVPWAKKNPKRLTKIVIEPLWVTSRLSQVLFC